MDAVVRQEESAGLLRQKIHQFRPKTTGAGTQEGERYGKTKATGPCAAGVEQKDAVAICDGSFVRVAADYDGDAGSDRIEVEIWKGVDEIEEVSIEFDGLSGRQGRAGSAAIDIAADGGQGGEGAQGVENSRVPHIAGVQDVIGVPKSDQSFRAQEAVSIGKDANQHSEFLKAIRMCGGERALAGRIELDGTSLA